MGVRDLLLDTNAYVAFKRGIPEAKEVIRHATLIGISGIVLGELLAGFAMGSRQTVNVVEIKRFMSSPRVISCWMMLLPPIMPTFIEICAPPDSPYRQMTCGSPLPLYSTSWPS